MKKGHLSSYFRGVAAKYLSAVEIIPRASHQHEFNGIIQLKKIFGPDRQTFNASFIYLGESEEEYIKDSGKLTWYDARERHPSRSEYRLYYPDNEVFDKAREGDLLLIGRRSDDSLMIIIARAGTTSEKNIIWLFNLAHEDLAGFTIRDVDFSDDFELDFASRFILEELGIEAIEADENYLDPMIRKFHAKFPSTSVFSEYARSTLSSVSAVIDPDAALLEWVAREEMLFRTLERHIVAERLREGFGDEVDVFISYSLSVQNRRKSRAGFALENHMEQILKDNCITYTREGVTENKTKPDFIFPDIINYHNPAFPISRLTMLGVKSTCKDRWRQVLSEADKISHKHLLTLQPGISENQTREMQANNLQLVLPRQLHETYSKIQASWLMDVATFLKLIKSRQKSL